MKHWKPIPGTPYEASKYGLIRNMKTGRIRNPFSSKVRLYFTKDFRS
jgi:hypothetical protein